MRVLITGANGFIGKNLRAVLMARTNIVALPFGREASQDQLAHGVASADVVVHLAGVNRPESPAEFTVGNAELTHSLCAMIRDSRRPIPLLLASSIQAAGDSAYGASKRAAEAHVLKLYADTGNPVAVYRLPNVFGKWARPNYNSAVATFCHNTIHGIPLTIRDPVAPVQLAYVDDVVADFLKRVEGDWPQNAHAEVEPVYSTTVGRLAETIASFRNSRSTLVTEPVGTGLLRALYATYTSYLPPNQFTYDLPKHEDARGVFVEFLKTRDCGQFSFFSAHPGVTRGEHYHHTKTEKFLVVRGTARFAFRHIMTGEAHVLTVRGDEPRIVESIPGWAHNITNIGDSEMLVMLWANEVFDRAKPDTYACKVAS